MTTQRKSIFNIEYHEAPKTVQKQASSSVPKDDPNKKNEFSVRVTVHEGRRLSGSNLRPVVRVRCGKWHQKSTTIKKGSFVIWNKEMMFNIEAQQKNLHKVLMEFIVNDSNRLRSDSLIGSFTSELGSVYNQPDHSYIRCWLLLTDPEDSTITPKGYLKVSIIVLGAGDVAPKDAGSDSDDDDITRNLLTPAGATLQHALFVLRVYKAENLLENMDIAPNTLKNPDPRLTFSFGGQKVKTKVIDDNICPEWNQELILPVKYPTMCEAIRLAIFDEDKTGKDYIGSVDIPVSKISVQESECGFLPTFGPTFFNIYQRPKKSLSESIVCQEYLTKTKQDTIYGGKYAGRVLVELITGLEKMEDSQRNDIRASQVDAVARYKNKVEYRLIAVLHDAGMIDKSEANKSIKFEVSIGNFLSLSPERFPALGGVHYCYIPWGSYKPVVSVQSQWESVEFRYAALNFLLGHARTLEENIVYIKEKMKSMEEEKNYDKEEVAFCIIEAIRDLHKINEFHTLDPRGIPEANTLDVRLYQTRERIVDEIIVKAEKLKNDATDEREAISELEDYLEEIKEISYECQNSIPDVMIWMIVKGKKTSVARIQVHDILYNKKGNQFSGNYCGRTQTVLLRDPEDERYKISCCLEMTLWLSRVEDHHEFAPVDPKIGKMCACVETIETRKGKWIPQKRKEFERLKGWKWGGDWEIRKTSGHSTSNDIRQLEAYEKEKKCVDGLWGETRFWFQDEEQKDLKSIPCEEGFTWKEWWRRDIFVDCGEDGWQYTNDADGGEDSHWWKTDNDARLRRRRRWTRNMKYDGTNGRVKSEDERMQGWETIPKEGIGRRWIRLMIPEKTKKFSEMFLPEAVGGSSSREIPRICLHFPIAIQLHMRVYLYQARDLSPLARKTFSKHMPFVYVSFMNKSVKSMTVVKSKQSDASNPCWNQTVELNLEYHGDSYRLRFYCPDVFLEIFRKSDIGSSEFLGRTSFQPVLTEFNKGKEVEEGPELEWRRILIRGDNYGGDILASAEIFLRDQNLPPIESQVPEKIRPNLERRDIEILLWGLRSLKTFRCRKVARPHVEIGIGNMKKKSEIMTTSVKNPNFETNWTFKANLPTKARYRPPIVIRLKDNRLFGFCPTVGEHVISDISKFYVNEKAGEDNEKSADTSGKDEKTENVESKKSIQSSSISNENFDWWAKYNASKYPKKDTSESYLETGQDTIAVYNGELEKQKGYNDFSDVLQTFRFFRRGTKEFAGELKAKIFLYPAAKDETQPQRRIPAMPSGKPVKVKVRVYVVCARNLAARDANGLADPYVKIFAGRKKVDDNLNYVPNALNPTFGRSYELDLILPLEKDLHVALFDHDLLNLDDEIGETIIDLENRYFSKYKAWCGLPKTYHTEGMNKWRGQMTPRKWLDHLAKEKKFEQPVWNKTVVRFNNQIFSYEKCKEYYESGEEVSDEDVQERLSLHVLREKFDHIEEHVETRQLLNINYGDQVQGEIELWVDMFPMDFGNPGPAIDITPRTPTKYFLRVVIWSCCEIAKSDVNIFNEAMSDIYIKGWMEGMEDKTQKTDVHYRSLDGTGMFNWRFVFPFDYLTQDGRVIISEKEEFWSIDSTTTKVKPVLHIQAWDNDKLMPHDNLGELSLPLHKTPTGGKTHKSATIDMLPSLDGSSEFPTTNVFKQKHIKGWWPLYKIVDREMQAAGKIEMTIEVLSEAEHEEKPAGKARDEPNDNPKLDPPKRPATSFDWISAPWKSFRFIVWRRYRKLVIIGLIAAPIAVFVVLFLYTLPNNFNRWLLMKS